MRIDRFGSGLDRIFRRWMPDPFVLALALTGAVAVAAAIYGDALADASALERASALLRAWRAHLFEPRDPDGAVDHSTLYFAFQMCVMLVTGHAVGSSRPVARAVHRLARLPRSPRAAVATVAGVAVACALVHWALGLVVGALAAREVGRHAASRGLRVHYPLLGAAGYAGMMVWGGGLSGSIPLKALEWRAPSGPLARAAEAAGWSNGIGLDATVFSIANAVIALSALVLVPALAAALHPRRVADDALYRGPAPEGDAANALRAGDEDSALRRWERARGPALAVAALGLGSLALDAAAGRAGLTFNTLNATFLFAGIGLHGSLVGYARAIGDAAGTCAGVILQFPFYFAILGLLVVSGLGDQLAAGLAALGSPVTYPGLTFGSAGLVNLVVPSGGGQWVVQGHVVIAGALGGGADAGRAVLALAYGDGWTNMLQPFWALPLLAITGLPASRLMGYTAALMLPTGVWLVTLLTWL